MSRLDIRPPVYDTGMLIPEQFGAVGNGTVDDGAALNRMFAAGTNYKLTSGKTYKTTIPLAVPYTCQSLVMTGAKIKFNLATIGSTSSVLVIGQSGQNFNNGVLQDLWVEADGEGAWSGDDGNCCIKIIDATNGRFSIRRVKGCTIGVQCLGSGSGWYYNVVTLGRFDECQWGLDLRSVAAGIGVNQNTFIGGEFHINSSTNVTQDACGVRYSFGTGGYELHNTNIHINPSFELNPGGAGVRTPVIMTCGLYNRLEGFRAETYSDYLALVSGTFTRRNLFRASYVSGGTYVDISDTSTNQDSICEFPTTYRGLDHLPGWSSGRLIDRVYHYSSTEVALRGIGLVGTGSDAYTNIDKSVFAVGGTGVTPRHDFLLIGGNRGVFVYVDTSLHKKFRIWHHAEGSAGGRWCINCYDADMTVQTAGTELVGNGFSTNATYGTCFKTGGDSIATQVFTVGDSTKFIRIILTGGSSALQLRSFGIQPLSGVISAPLTVWSDPKQGGRDIMSAASIPTATYGRYMVGDEVLNNGATTAISTGLRGWKCTTAGALAPAWVISTAYVAGQLVLNDTNKIYWCKTAGTSAGSGGPTGNTEGTDITDNTVTWRYLCPLAVFTTMWTPTVPLVGSATWDPASIANGAQATTTITVTGAALGDIVLGSHSISQGGLSFTYEVSASNTVTVTAQNNSGAGIDLGSATVRAAVWPKAALGL